MSPVVWHDSPAILKIITAISEDEDYVFQLGFLFLTQRKLRKEGFICLHVQITLRYLEKQGKNLFWAGTQKQEWKQRP